MSVTHRVGVIGGDGIGPEGVAVALEVVDAAGVAVESDYDLGGARYLRGRGAPGIGARRAARA